MMVVRPVKESDWTDLRHLASQTGPGFTSLQDNDEQVRGKLDAGIKAFDPETRREDISYLFVLEDTEQQKVVGVCAIYTAVGMCDPWYNYRVGTVVHASRELDVYNQTQTLSISNDYTGYTEMATLFLSPDYRHSKNGHLLSKSRFLFLAEHPKMFHEMAIAEMRGYSDENGVSPFWEGLGRHFFTIDFAKADQLSYRDKAFIAELMPKYPIYTNLLPETAVEVIAKTHDKTVPARRLLEGEGFRYGSHIDIFDGGPVLEAPIKDIRAVRDSRNSRCQVVREIADEKLYLISNGGYENYRCCMGAALKLEDGQVAVTEETASALDIKPGDTVRLVPLFAERSA